MILDKILPSFGKWRAEVAAQLKGVSYAFGGPVAQWFNMGQPTGDRNPTDYYKAECYVYACTWLIASTIAQLPVKVYRRKYQKGEIVLEPQPNHELYKLLENPAFYMSYADLIEWLASYYLLTGKMYLILNDPKKPTAVTIADPTKITWEFKDSSEVSGYEDVFKWVKYGKKEVPLDILLFETAFHPDNAFDAIGPLQAGAVSAELMLSAKKSNSRVFKNGMQLQGIMESEQPAPKDEDEKKRLGESLKQRHGGEDNAGSTLLLWRGLKYKAIGISPRDMEYIAGMKYNREEICGALFQVPLILLGVLENASYNNIREATKLFYNNAVMTRAVKVEELLTKLARVWGPPDTVVKFDYSGVEALRETFGEKSTQFATFIQNGVPYNEAKKMLNLPLEDQPWGNTGYLPFSLTPAGSSEPSSGGDDKGACGHVHKAAKLKGTHWTPELKAARWKAFDKDAAAVERAYKPQVAAHFTEQEAQVQAKVGRYKGITGSVISVNGEPVVRVTADDGVIKDSVSVDSLLFDDESESRRLAKLAKPYHAKALEQQGASEYAFMQLAGSFSVSNPRVAAWLAKYGLNMAKGVTGTTKDRLRETLIEGIKAGEDVRQLTARVTDVYDVARGARAENIARTETATAANQGSLEAYKQGGIPRKGWLGELDSRIRDTHAVMTNQYSEASGGIPIDQDFISPSGASGPAPGQMNDPAEDCSCRCALFGIVPTEE